LNTTVNPKDSPKIYIHVPPYTTISPLVGSVVRFVLFHISLLVGSLVRLVLHLKPRWYGPAFLQHVLC
jgi:hypothetical protein